MRGAALGPGFMAEPECGSPRTTIVITHTQCASHSKFEDAKERPERVAIVMSALDDLHAANGGQQHPPFAFERLSTSNDMLQALKVALVSNDMEDSGTIEVPTVQTTFSTELFENLIVPGVRETHSAEYLGKLAKECYDLTVRQHKLSPRRTLAAEAKRLDNDTPVSASSLSAALYAVISSCRAVDKVCRGAHRNAFVAIRPPGHHAGRGGIMTAGDAFTIKRSSEHFVADQSEASKSGAFAFADKLAARRCDELCYSQGFCLLNNAAIAARHALVQYGTNANLPGLDMGLNVEQEAAPATIRRVAIIDIDLHHGNGTEEIVRGWSDVLYASLHCAGQMPADIDPNRQMLYPGTALKTQVEERLINVALPPKTTASTYMCRFDELVAPAVRAYRPDLIIISCGFDAHVDDSPVEQGVLALSTADYAQLTAKIKVPSRLVACAHPWTPSAVSPRDRVPDPTRWMCLAGSSRGVLRGAARLASRGRLQRTAAEGMHSGARGGLGGLAGGWCRRFYSARRRWGRCWGSSMQ